MGAPHDAPLVSIGLPVRNGAPYLPAAIESLLAQTYPHFELILSDNASEDATRAICERYAARDGRIRYHRLHTNIGAAPNFNRVFRLARGPYFKWAAHDDICLPGMLQACVEAFASVPPSVVLVYPQTVLIDAGGTPTGADDLHLATRGVPAHRRVAWYLNTVRLTNPVYGLIRSDVLRRTRLIDSFCSSDEVLLAELLMLGEFHEIDAVLFQRRRHEQSSRRAHPNPRDLIAWFDPSVRGLRSLVPRDLRLTWEFTRSAWRIPPSAGERLQCLRVVARARAARRLRFTRRRMARWLTALEPRMRPALRRERIG